MIAFDVYFTDGDENKYFIDRGITTPQKAIKIAKGALKSISDKIFISFYRDSDGISGFLNRNGFSSTGVPW